VIRARVRSFLAHARRWTAEALGSHHTRLENEHRRMLAADVTELGMIAIHLPFDQRWAPATKRRVTALQQQLASILPLASAAANRLDRLRDGGGLPAELEALLDDVSDWLVDEDSPLHQAGALVRRCEAMAEAAEARADWTSLLTASACVRIAEFLAALAASRRLATRIGSPGRSRSRWRATMASPRWRGWRRRRRSRSTARSGSCSPGPTDRRPPPSPR
jgi:hypothetical protein